MFRYVFLLLLAVSCKAKTPEDNPSSMPVAPLVEAVCPSTVIETKILPAKNAMAHYIAHVIQIADFSPKECLQIRNHLLEAAKHKQLMEEKMQELLEVSSACKKITSEKLGEIRAITDEGKLESVERMVKACQSEDGMKEAWEGSSMKRAR